MPSVLEEESPHRRVAMGPLRDVAQLVRAPILYVGGRRFKSFRPYQDRWMLCSKPSSCLLSCSMRR